MARTTVDTRTDGEPKFCHVCGSPLYRQHQDGQVVEWDVIDGTATYSEELELLTCSSFHDKPVVWTLRDPFWVRS